MRFQFHDGSIQAGVRGSLQRLMFLFQFHDGSIQARAIKNRAHQVIIVSIPRWFDSSNICVPLSFTPESGFNSTMVRFKRGPMQVRTCRSV